MRHLLLKAAIAAVLPLCTLPALAAGRCGGDTISTASFESVTAVKLAGVVGGLQAGTVVVRGGEAVFFEGTIQNGSFFVELPPMAPERMLELRVLGTGDQAFIELAAYVGTVQQVLDQADGDGTARVAGLPTLRVNAESTARYALTQATFGDQTPVIAHECQLAALEDGLDAGAVLERAAVIKILIEDGGIAPATAAVAKGSAPTTLGVVLDETTYQSTLGTIETSDPGRIAAMTSLLTEPFCSYFDNEAILLYQARAVGAVMNSSSEHLFRRMDASSGVHYQSYGPDAYTWACTGDVADVDFAGLRVSMDFPFREVGGVLQQVTAEYRQLDATLTRVDSGTDFVTVAIHGSYEYSFPFNPELPTEYSSGESLLVLVRQPTGTLFDAATVPGEYLMPTSGRYGDEAANRVRLDIGGTGEDLDAGLPVAWEVTPEGGLTVFFADRTALLAPVRDEAANVRDVLSVVESSNGQATLGQFIMLRRTFPAGWADDSAVPGEYRQHDYRSSDPHYKLVLAADRTAPSFSEYDSGDLQPSTYYYWSRPAADTLVLRVCEHFENDAWSYIALLDREPVAGECNSWYRRRTWTLYTTEGQSLYVRELNEDWYADPAGGQGPDFRFDRSMMYAHTAPVAAAASVSKAAPEAPVGVQQHAPTVRPRPGALQQ